MQIFLQYILPALVTALMNLFFYIAVKRRVDNSIEKFKIAYSGIFKEKVDIYKTLLNEVYDLKVKLHQFPSSYEQNKLEIQTAFNKLIKVYSINRPFLSDTIVELFRTNTIELQGIFENMVIGDISKYYTFSQEEILRREDLYWSAINRLGDNKILGAIEERIIYEMKADLQT